MGNSVALSSRVRITDDQWERLNGFNGYGNIRAPIWFLGMEEGGSDDPVLIGENLKRRERFTAEMDLENAMNSLLAPNFVTLSKTKTHTWRWMSKLAIMLKEGKSEVPNRARVREYIDRELGRIRGETFLTELMPLPAKNLSQEAWYYTKQDGNITFTSREEYLSTVLETRKEKLKALIAGASRSGNLKYLFAYGSGYHADYKQLAPITETEWQKLPGSERNILIGSFGDRTMVVLTPFFGFGGLNNQSLTTLVGFLLKETL